MYSISPTGGYRFYSHNIRFYTMADRFYTITCGFFARSIIYYHNPTLADTSLLPQDPGGWIHVFLRSVIEIQPDFH